jgi:uncharacterized membrane protein YfcA
MFFILYVITGAFAGLLAGLFGIGGGVLIIPVLLFLLPHVGVAADIVMPVAIATSLASVILNTSVASYAQLRRDNVDFKLLKKTLPPTIIAAILGPILTHHLPTAPLKLFFAIFLFVVAFRMFQTANTIEKAKALPPLYQLIPVIFILALLSSMLGLGGGLLLLPYLLYCGLTMKRSLGTATVSTLMVALMASAIYVIMGLSLTDRIPQCLGYIYLPALLGLIMGSFIFAKMGVSLSHTLPVPQLKKIFAVVVFLIALLMIL